MAMEKYSRDVRKAREMARGGDGDLADVFRAAFPARYQSLDGDEMEVMKEILREGMNEVRRAKQRLSASLVPVAGDE